MIIKVKNMNIKMDIININKFIGIENYLTNENYKYSIITKTKIDFILPKIKAKLNTKYYQLFDFDEYQIQKQIDENNNLLGYIYYNKNEVYLYPINKSFEIEYLLSQYALVYFLRLEKDSLFMHGSSIMYKNKGIIFTAKSGTGKSTHAKLWLKNSNAITINDDKNIIALIDDKLKIYSSPWSGKEMLNNNISTTLDSIIFLYQNKTNTLEKINNIKALKLLLGQIENLNENNKEIWNKIVDKMLELPIYYYGCNIEDEAFYTLKEGIKELWD